MISTAKVFQRVSQLLKTGTSGYTSDEEFSSDLVSTKIDIQNLLCDNYEKNQKITDLMNKDGMIKTLVTNTASDGTLSFPEDHYRSFNFTVTDADRDLPVIKIGTNERGMYSTSPIRQFSAQKKRYGYYVADSKFHIQPVGVVPVKFVYAVKIDNPVLELTSDENDFQVVGPGTVDIDLPENLFNLFVYKMLERAGMEQKESLAMEYSQLGINNETL